MPPISPDGGLPLALARGLAVAALLSAFGALVFRALILPKLARRLSCVDVDAAIRRLARQSLGFAVLALLCWAVLQTADLAQTGADVRALATALPIVLGDTLFGHVWLAQLATACAGLVLLPAWPGTALVACAAAVVLQAGHSHALSMDGPGLLLLFDVVHLVAAGAWLGGLWPLLLSARRLPPLGGALAARWFSPLGKWCVAGMVGSAAVQFWGLIGGLSGLIGTPYGWVASAKLTLLVALLAFAALNRYRLAPALLRPGVTGAQRVLIRSIALQTGVGLVVILAAGILSGLPPALHEQPRWTVGSLSNVDVAPG